MNCPADGVLRTFVDGEVAGGEFDAVGRHVRDCEACQRRLNAIEEQAGCVREKLEGLMPEPIAVDSHAAYDRFRHASEERAQRAPVEPAAQRPYAFLSVWRHGIGALCAFEGRASGIGALWTRFAAGWKRPLAGALAVACALAMLLSFSPGRTWAQKVLEMLRVQKVAVVPVDLPALAAQNGNGREHLLAQFISDNVTVTLKPGPSVPAADVAAASLMAGFTVKTLDPLGTPQRIQVRNEGAFQMTLDHDRIQAVLDQGGRSDIQIPESVDGSLIAVHVPKAVHLRYGSCGPKANGAAAPSTDESCINFVQVPSPIVSIPPGLDIAALAEAGLQIAGMSASEAHSYAQTIDWSSTLVIPVPQTGGSYRTVPVDGVNGTLIESAPHGSYPGAYQLIWVKNGIVYSLGGRGTSDRALAAAASLS